MSKLEKVVRDIITSVNDSIEQKNWYSAVALAITLPDICCRLDGSKPDNKSADPYINWFDKYVGKNYCFKPHGEKNIIFINGKHAYALRCAFLHDGSGDLLSHGARDKELGIDSIAFFIPEDDCNTSNGVWVEQSAGVINRKLILNVAVYCRYITNGVDNWLLEYQSNNGVLTRAEKMIDINKLLYYTEKTN